MAPRVHLELEIELTEPISGHLRTAAGREREFTGWLALHAALADVRKTQLLDAGGESSGRLPEAKGLSGRDDRSP